MLKAFWELRVVILMLLAVAGIVGLLIAYPWLLLVPVAFVILSFPALWIRRRRSLRNRGYFIGLSMRNSRWTYEERVDGILRKVDLAHRESAPETTLVVPTLAKWAEKAPPWALHRREEMFRKLISEEPATYISYPSDWEFTREESASQEAVESEGTQDIERMKRDLRIGQKDSEWKMETNAEGVSSFSRKS
ncbi:MAG: hypothetical protein KF712_00580 [Akkermansiaceae bacterium]|nr:hypothetical protein [Akkermansiaceae bacterium]